ncbi:Tetraspanin-33 [Mactra antiquata]
MACCADGETVVNPIIKYILLFGTFLHWTCGGVMVGVGIWAFVEKNKYFYQPIEDVYDILLDLSIMMIVVGGIMFIITMCGFVGALRENTCLLRVFYISLVLIFLAEVVCGALAFIFKDQAVNLFSNILEEVYILGYQDDEEAVIDHFQETYDCCGIRGFDDWNRNDYFNCTDENPSPLSCAVPYSCCKDPDELSPGLNNILCGASALAVNSTTTDKIWTIGCVDSLISLAEENLPIIGAIVLGVAIPQLMGIVLGHIFVGQIQRQWQIYNASKRKRGYREQRGQDRY